MWNNGARKPLGTLLGELQGMPSEGERHWINYDVGGLGAGIRSYFSQI